MNRLVYVLEILDKRDPWSPLVFDTKEKAIDKGIDILTEWFPSEWDTNRIETAKQTLQTRYKYIFMSESEHKVTLEIYSCKIF